MRAILRISVLVVLVTLTFGFRSIDIQKASMRFDQGFIPIWYYTYEGNHYRAKLAVFYMDFQWQRLKKVYDQEIRDDFWAYEARQIADWLASAYVAIDAGQLNEANQLLDRVKNNLMNVRKRHRINYQLDDIYRLQTNLLAVKTVIEDPKLGLLEWNELELLVNNTLEDWEDIKDEKMNLALYQIDADVYERGSNQLDSQFDQFRQAMETAERETVQDAFAGVDAAFKDFLQLFGRSDLNKTFFAAIPGDDRQDFQKVSF